jgi:cytochrome c-type biogenesis protein
VSEYAKAFTLGNAAILSNVCLLPLYPGLVVMLSARLTDPRSKLSTMSLGVAVLAGIVTFMVALGFVLYQLSRAVADILDWLLPLIYGTVFVLGVLMLLGRNPFTRLVRTEAPVLRSPTATAYLYGVFLAPMTLPCTGPLVVSAFVIGGVSGSDALADSLTYFVFYAVGFGWPLVVLPILAAPAQRQITRFLARHRRMIEVLSGLLLIAIAIYGYWTEARPATR